MTLFCGSVRFYPSTWETLKVDACLHTDKTYIVIHTAGGEGMTTALSDDMLISRKTQQ